MVTELAHLIKGRITTLSINVCPISPLLLGHPAQLCVISGTAWLAGRLNACSFEAKKMFYEAASPAHPLRDVKDELCTSWHLLPHP